MLERGERARGRGERESGMDRDRENEGGSTRRSFGSHGREGEPGRAGVAAVWLPLAHRLARSRQRLLLGSSERCSAQNRAALSAVPLRTEQL